MLGFESREHHWIITGLPKDPKKYFGYLVNKAPSLAHFLPWNIFANHANRKRKSVISPGIVSFAAQISRNTIHGRCSQDGAAGGILAGFICFSDVVCLDVSQQLDYMVCKCTKGILQLCSLFTGRLVWTRPPVTENSYNMDSFLPSRGFNARWLNSWLAKKKGWQNRGVYCYAVFSPKVQLLVVSAVGLLVLDAKTGNTPRTFLRHYLFHLNFISDKECVISHSDSTV